MFKRVWVVDWGGGVGGRVLSGCVSVSPSLCSLSWLSLCLDRTVDLGPFKHQIDDGLELRKVGTGMGQHAQAWQLPSMAMHALLPAARPPP